MKRVLYYSLMAILLCTFYCTRADGQARKKTVSKKKNTSNPQTYTSPVFTNEEDLQKWLYQDSVKRAFSDSVQAIKDSVNAAAEMIKINAAYEKVYQQYYNPEDSLSYIDRQTTTLMKTWTDITVDSACLLIVQKFSSPLQKARAIFHWVAARVHYDWFSYSHGTVMPIFNKDEDALRTFKYRTGVCQNYSNLYSYMCRKSGVECVVLNGWGKNFPICISGDTDKDPNHAWNAVRIKNKWLLLDVTWAATDTSGSVDNYWFNTAPGEFIYSHLPQDSSFQLIKNPVAKKQFASFPIVSESLFLSKLDFDIPETGNFILTADKFSISMPAAIKGYDISYTLIPYNGTRTEAYNNSNQWVREPQTQKISDKKNKMTNYEVTIPSKGIWWVAIDISKATNNPYVDTVTFYQAVMFKVTCK